MIFSQFEQVLRKNFPLDWTIDHFTPKFDFGKRYEKKIYSKIGITLYASKRILIEAQKRKINLLLTYIPLFLKPIAKIDDIYIDQSKILALSNLSLFSIGDTLNFMEGGVTDTIIRNATLSHIQNLSMNYNNIDIPIGRLCIPIQENLHLKTLLMNLKRNLQIPSVQYWPNGESIVKRVVIIDPHSLALLDLNQIVEKNVDTIISYDLPLELISTIINFNITTINLSGYICLDLSLRNFTKQLSILLPRIEIDYIETLFPDVVI